jgi:hypothetical protein
MMSLAEKDDVLAKERKRYDHDTFYWRSVSQEVRCDERR